MNLALLYEMFLKDVARIHRRITAYLWLLANMISSWNLCTR